MPPEAFTSGRLAVAALTVAALAVAAPSILPAQSLADGLFDLPNSTGPGDPGFNSALTANHTLPTGLGATAGAAIHVRLRDAGRPDKVCDLDDDFGDLFNGCAAVDWPFQDRRGINLVEVETDEGPVTLHLRMDDSLSLVPEPDGP